MDFYELKNKYFSLVRKKMINDYKMGNIDFMESEELLDHIIERIGMYQDHGKSDDESIASAFRDFHGKLLALRPLTLRPGSIPATQPRPNSICRRRPHPAATKPTNRRYLRVNGRRPPPLGSLFAMPALGFSSARPAIPSTRRLWTSWAASSGAVRTTPRLRCRRTCRRRLLRWQRSPPQSRWIRWKRP